MNNKFPYCVYLIKNKINNKCYVGKTSNENKRWRDHIRKSEGGQYKNQPIHCALKKYGWNNFEFSVIKRYKKECSAYKGEDFYIKKFKSLVSQNGYNIVCNNFGKKSRVSKNLSDKMAKKVMSHFINTNDSMIGIAKYFKLSESLVEKLIKRKIYLHLNFSDDVLYKVWLKLNRPWGSICHHNDNSTRNKISDEFVEEIMQKYIDGYSRQDLLKVYDGHTLGHIRKLKFNQNKRNLSPDILNKFKDNKQNSNKRKRTTVQDKINLLNDYISGATFQELANRYNLCVATIYSMVQGTSHKKLVISTVLQKQVHQENKKRQKNYKGKTRNKRYK